MSTQDQAQDIPHVPLRSSAKRVLAGGMLGMMVAMGIGRFAFTPILPLMQRDLGLSHSLAGGLASLNYAGYLTGALVCAVWPRVLRKTAVNLGALLACIATTALMGMTYSPFWWGSLRLLAGGASAVLFVLIAIEVSESLAYHRHSHWNSALYGGIGLGIAVSGITVPLLDRINGWQGAWLGMGALSGLLALCGVALAGKHQVAIHVPNSNGKTGIRPAGLTGLPRLALAYFMEGVGYIVSATFLVTIIAHTPGLSGFAPWSWVAVGLAAAPSTILWQQVALRIGVRPALASAYVLQAAGLLLSIGAGSALRAGLAAIIFGGTFLGIVSLVMAEGVRRTGSEGRRAAAVLTACFSAGQVIGPPVAGILADFQGGFSLALLLAATVVMIGFALVITDAGYVVKPDADKA